jgi:hypothetical protein
MRNLGTPRQVAKALPDLTGVPRLPQVEYHDLRADMAAEARDRNLDHPFQLCARCGHCEYAGGFCSWCKSATYDLILHTHPNTRAGCPLTGVVVYTPGSLRAVYRHEPGASRRRFAVRDPEASAGRLEALAKAREVRSRILDRRPT